MPDWSSIFSTGDTGPTYDFGGGSYNMTAPENWLPLEGGSSYPISLSDYGMGMGGEPSYASLSPGFDNYGISPYVSEMPYMSGGGAEGGGFMDMLSGLNKEYLQPAGQFLQSPGGSLLGGLGMGALSYFDRASANKSQTKANKKMLAQRQAVLDQMNARAAKYDAPIMGATNERGPAASEWGVGSNAFANNSLGAIKPGSAPGYLSGFAEGGYADGGTPGQSDQIPAMLSDGEFVIDAATVADLGDGNNAAGASALERMRQNVRKHKRSAPTNKIPPKAKKPEQYMKGKK